MDCSRERAPAPVFEPITPVIFEFYREERKADDLEGPKGKNSPNFKVQRSKN